ncbi:MAG: YqhA family protein [Burkholderiales bacterium]|nr:YqhA family protein [Burkholderiales bacterium]
MSSQTRLSGSSAATQPRPHGRDDAHHDSRLARLIGRSRNIILIAVAAVMICAFSLFLLGAILAAQTVWTAWSGVLAGHVGTTDLTLRFLEIVTVMLKAVFFYLIGVGFYSLFISPLNVTVALGVETLNDLETKIISVVIVIMAVSFLERFIDWQGRDEVLWSAGALGLVVAALTVFQWQTHRAGQEHKHQHPDILERAKVEMFERAHEEHEITPDEADLRFDEEEASRRRGEAREAGERRRKTPARQR